MNKEQYDVLHLAIIKQSESLARLNVGVGTLTSDLTELLANVKLSLTSLTTLRDLSEQVAKLQIELKSLKDEKEA